MYYIKSIIKKLIPDRKWKDFQHNLSLQRNYKLMKKRKKYNYFQIEEMISKEYLIYHQKKLNWDHPVSYTEKLNIAKLYCDSKLKTRLTDKYLVRDWVEERIGSQYLIPLLGKYDSFDEIDFNKLPEKFVLKCNHDSGSCIICNHKSDINYAKAKKMYDMCLKINMGSRSFQMHYYDIVPCILAEKNMGDNIFDYKFLCFDGEPYYCWVDTDRFSSHKRIVYDMSWQPQPFCQGNHPISEGVPKPGCFDEMVRIVKILAQGFDHVRVDMYTIDDKIYFGEMTFTNGNGMEPIHPPQYDDYLGKLWKSFDNSKRNIVNKNDCPFAANKHKGTV